MSRAEKKFQSQQEKNGLKVRRLVEKTDNAVLILFHKHFSSDPKELYQELLKQKNKLDNLKTKKKLKEDQYQLLFPNSQETHSDKFDTTLTFLLIRTLCGYTPPSTGWDIEPDNNDVSEIAQAIRLKLARNISQHSRLSISTQEYKKLFNLFSKPLLALGQNKDDLLDLLPPFEYDIPKETGDFIGRENELKQIWNLLSVNQSRPSNNSTNQSNVVITGIPGSGKSELANMFFHKNKSEFDHVIWLDMDNKDVVLENIAKILQFDEKKNAKVICHRLKDYFEGENLLFIFDNCTDIQSLTDLVKISKHNIITTQINKWGNGYDIIELKTWPVKTAWDFIKKSLTNTLQSDVKSLALELGNHPLGIKHATCFMNEINLSLEEYLAELKQRKGDILSEKVAINIGVPISVFTSFALAIEKMETMEPDDAKMMYLLGVLDGSFISEEFLQRFTADKLRFKRILSWLRNHSLVKVNQETSEFNDKITRFVTVHSLYKEAIKIHLIKQKKAKETVELALKMIAQKGGEFGEDYYQDQKIWGNQLEYLWKQNISKEILVESLSSFPEILILKEIRSVSWVVEILKSIKNKNDITTEIFYFAEFYVDFQPQLSRNSLIMTLKDICQRLTLNVSNSIGKNYLMTDVQFHIKNYENPKIQEKDRNFYQGHFEYFLTDLSEVLNKDATLFQHQYISVCLKELGRYDEALDILDEEPDFANREIITKAQIGCCWILKGNLEKGMHIIESVPEISEHFNSIIDVGRALFQVGRVLDSKQYLRKVLSIGKIQPDNIFYIDAICIAMKVFDDVDEKKFTGCISENEPEDFKVIRWQLLYCCRLVQSNKFTGADQYVDDCITKEIESREYTGDVFREILMMANHWLVHSGYLKALWAFRLIEKLKNKVYNHDHIIKPIDWKSLDVQDKIKECVKNFRKIFHI